jgi:hypothetical protein
VPTINLSADELAAVTAAIRGVIEGDRYPHAPRLDPLHAALARFEAGKASPAPRPRRQPKTSGRGDNRIARSSATGSIRIGLAGGPAADVAFHDR